MDNINCLVHHGTKGMRWGVRRYQTKDGALTPAGQKRYNKDTEKLKDEKKRLRNEDRTRKKIEKLDKLKSEVDDLKSKNKDDKVTDKEEKKVESIDEKRERLLKSNDPKELYENKNLLTTNELNERINRIDTEARLKSKIVEEHKKTGIDYVNDKLKKTSDTINNVNNTFKNIDNAYSTVVNSTIGKTVAKKLGLEPPKKKFNFDDFWNNRHEKTANEMSDAVKWLTAEDNLKRRRDRAEEEARARQRQEADDRLREAQRQVDEYNRRLYERNEDTTYRFRGRDLSNSRDYIDRDGSNRLRLETTGENIVGEGISRFRGWNESPNEETVRNGRRYLNGR